MCQESTVHGALGLLGAHVQSHAQVLERIPAEEKDTHIVSAQIIIVNPELIHGMIVATHNPVRFGLTGPVGVIVLSLVMVVLKHELANVKMVNQTTVLDHLPTKNNVTDNPVSLHSYTGVIVAFSPTQTRLKQLKTKFLLKVTI